MPYSDAEVAHLLDVNARLRIDLARLNTQLAHVEKLKDDMDKLRGFNLALNEIAERLRDDNAQLDKLVLRSFKIAEEFTALAYNDNLYTLTYMFVIIGLCLALKYGAYCSG